MSNRRRWLISADRQRERITKRNVTVAILVTIVIVGTLIGLTQGQHILNAFGFWTPVPCRAGNC
jgi:nucleoside permease NupC